MILYVYVYSSMMEAALGGRLPRDLRGAIAGSLAGLRKGTNRVSTNGVTAILLFFTEGLPLTYFYLPISARGVPFVHNLSKLIITFAAAPSVLTPVVRSQGLLQGERAPGSAEVLEALRLRLGVGEVAALLSLYLLLLLLVVVVVVVVVVV